MKTTAVVLGVVAAAAFSLWVGIPRATPATPAAAAEPKTVVAPAPEVQVVEKIVEKIIEVPIDPLPGLDVYVRTDWAKTDKFLRTLDEYSGAEGYTKEFLTEKPLFLSNGFAERPFFLVRRDFYMLHRGELKP